MDYNVTSPRGLTRWFVTRGEAIGFAEGQERQWRELCGFEVPHAIYYHGREVIRDEAEARADVARRSAVSTVRHCVKMGRLRRFRGGVIKTPPERFYLDEERNARRESEAGQ